MRYIPLNPRRVGYIVPIHGPLGGPLYMGSHIHQQCHPKRSNSTQEQYMLSEERATCSDFSSYVEMIYTWDGSKQRKMNQKDNPTSESYIFPTCINSNQVHINEMVCIRGYKLIKKASRQNEKQTCTRGIASSASSVKFARSSDCFFHMSVTPSHWTQHTLAAH